MKNEPSFAHVKTEVSSVVVLKPKPEDCHTFRQNILHVLEDSVDAIQLPPSSFYEGRRVQCLRISWIRRWTIVYLFPFGLISFSIEISDLVILEVDEVDVHGMHIRG